MSLVDTLRTRYPAQSYALFAEVQSATAYQGRQRADAVAMGLWPSRGLDVIGFEYKCSRSDWLRELKQPDKAEEIFRFCDRWFLVVNGEGIVKAGELPETWGLLVADGKTVKVAKEAPKLDAKPVSREFLASLLRSAQKDRDRAAAIPRIEIEGKVRAELAEQEDEHRREFAAQIEKERNRRLEMEERFLAAFGVRWNDWAAPVETVAATVALLAGKRSDIRSAIGAVRASLRDLLTRVEKAEEEVATVPSPRPASLSTPTAALSEAAYLSDDELVDAETGK